MATPQELMKIGQQFCEQYNQQQIQQCQQMYAQNAVSVEAAPMPGQASAEAVGLEAIKGKNEWWQNNNEMHSAKAEGPFIHGENRFSVIFDIDVTNKQTQERTQMREVAQYFVENGQIVREEFSYAINGE